MMTQRNPARHLPEYMIEAAGLGLFMFSAASFAVLLEHPSSPLRTMIHAAALRRVLMGLAMGLTAVGIIYSPWGKRSGAHINPAVTLTFLRLGKIDPGDAMAYMGAQCLGGLAGLMLAWAVLGEALAAPEIRFVATVPGTRGTAVALGAEVLISFGLMATVLLTTNSRALGRYTGLFAGGLVALYIALESPLSGMSMNPARSLASAVPGRVWDGFWIYAAAPVTGMLAAAELYLWWAGRAAVRCAKLHHENTQRCIFRCGYCRHETGDTASSGTRKPSERGVTGPVGGGPLSWEKT